MVSAILEERRQDFHLDIVLLNGGDPKSMMQLAEKEIRRRDLGGKDAYVARFAFLDRDRLIQNAVRGQQAIALANRLGISVIWQVPCHEAMLLNHLPGCHLLQPQTTAIATQRVHKEWPEYVKPMTAMGLRTRLDRDAVLRVAAVHPQLNGFLHAIGFM
ncbi:MULTISPECIES: hypothetical protein [unclassified Mesorhizobium]|uniref:hypothetical protein n=1 Tax=unclassified Mesorhizobium TaxID=325217 RepID=UPI0012EB343A|nr:MULTISPECIES: hypothetical protein [unclassified Mesorhizobium]WJI78657.1 hypothetical protein NLY34_17360 [Mesorhizobium sp. C374B]WJI85191.1 hypothetical protein NLY42_19760 [Mesorhizobium sp. C372A]